MSDTEYIQVTHRELPYATFDADNHLYENRDALTKFLPREYEGSIKYVEVDGRTKLAIRDQISEYIPNPTFGKVAVPGRLRAYDVTKGGRRRSAGGPSLHSQKMLVMPGIDAFFDPEPRLALMKDMGIDRTLLWPTLASVLEERVADDPDVAVAVIHALNEWMHEHWSFVYSDAIFSTPIISLAAGIDRALEELEYVHERGAKIFLIRVAPGADLEGPQVVRPARVRPVLGAGAGARHRRRHALRRPRLPALPQRVGGHRRPEMSIAVQAPGGPPGVPGLVVGEGQPGRRHGLDHRPRPGHPVPEAEVHAGGVRQPAGSGRSTRSSSGPTSSRRCSSTRTRSRCSSATSGCTPSTSPTRRA